MVRTIAAIASRAPCGTVTPCQSGPRPWKRRRGEESAAPAGWTLEYDHTLRHTVLAMAETARVTVTLAAQLVEDIDRLERNRSRFIAEAVEHELTRRRQAALLKSIASPHAETVALVDTGLADWLADLPADEGLVDVDAGTPVRWVEGKGWKKGRA